MEGVVNIMNVLVLNGSPNGKNSTTMVLTQHFVDGLNTFENNSIKIIDLSKKNIEYCLGCLLCWKRAPYTCVIQDDMDELISLFKKAQLIIWSFPLYHGSIPGKMKTFLDRTLPMSRPVIRPVNSKFVEKKIVPLVPNDRKHVLISSCGYIFPHSYEVVYEMFVYNFGERAIEAIFCKGWQACLINKLDFRDEYLSKIKRAGKEYSLFGKFSERTKEYLLNATCDEKEFCSDFMDYFDLNIDSDSHSCS